jgi:hypothetical protein
MKRILAAFALLALGGCADYLAVDGAGHTTAAPPKDALVKPVRGDTCHAGDLQYLVGKNKAEAPAPVDPSTRRVYCSNCAVTMDYAPSRLDIVFDEKSGTITQVKCG